VTSLTAAERARAQAEAKLAEVEARLAQVEDDAKGILEDASRRAQAEHDRILGVAAADARRLLEQAEARVGELESSARRRLRGLAADLAIEAARELIGSSIQNEDRLRSLERNLKALQSQGG
jgi:F-type H+-transporting ATPase subunit b